LLTWLGAVSVSTWYEVDITALITGDGTYSLRISDSQGGADYSSKEGAYPPQLVITLAGTPTPTTTSVATNTPTATQTATPTPTASQTAAPSLTPTFTPTPTQVPSGPVTINYTYDPLNRLTAADYSTGDTYHYTYDAVGNRLNETTHLATTNYLYDDANRIQTVNGVIYDYDANGNLKNDGVNAYTYDSANRLKTMNIGQPSATSYQYNGLGDRISQTVNAQTTTYTLDLNAGLTQVLADGSNTYLYGAGRIGQVNNTTEYFLGDALGSVRQLTNTTGDVTLAKSYQPYGETLSSVGSGSSPFAYTGEQVDVNGLVYLRARYYASDTGRFLTKDSWMGDYNRPLSLNRWMYVEGNPVNYTDPSGYITEKETKRAELILENLDRIYDVQIKKDWGKRPIPLFSSLPPSVTSYPDGCYWEEGNWRSLDELEWTLQAVKDFTKAFGPQKGLFSTAMRWQPVRIDRIPTKYIFDSGAFTTILTNVILPNDVFDSRDEKWAKGQIVHELAHVMDYRQTWPPSRLSNGMAMLTKSFKEVCQIGRGGVQICNLVYDPMGENESPPSLYAQNNPQEDWAESFKFFIYPSFGDLEQIREDYIKDVIWDLKTP